MFKWLRKLKQYVCKCFNTERDHSEYMPLMNVDLEYEYIPIPISPLSDDNIAFYD